MEKEYTVLEGKTFTVDLLSYVGSTNYAWCLSALPEEIILLASDNVPAGNMDDATTVQRFYFGAVSADNDQVEIEFTMHCLSELSEVSDNCKVKVSIIPENEFVNLSDTDSTKLITAYAFPDPRTSIKNNFDSCSPYAPRPAMDYGFPECSRNTNLIYGYSCGVQDANLKYGYSCGVRDANLKYGYPSRDYAKDMRLYGVPYIE